MYFDLATKIIDGLKESQVFEGRSREDIQKDIDGEISEINNYVKLYTSKYGGYFDSFEMDAPKIYHEDKHARWGVRVVRAGAKTRFGRRKLPTYLYSDKLKQLFDELKLCKKENPTEEEKKEKEKRKLSFSQSRKEAEEREKLLVNIGISQSEAHNERSSDAAYVISYFDGKLDKDKLYDLYWAVKSNRETKGKSYLAWKTDELDDDTFVKLCIGAYNRHTNTDYDDELQRAKEYGLRGQDVKDFARDSVKGQWEKNESLSEETTAAAISYLPSQVGQVHSTINSLAQEKEDWDIDILTGDNENEFSIGKKVKYRVPKEHWDGFLKIFGSRLNGKKLKLIKEEKSKFGDYDVVDSTAITPGNDNQEEMDKVFDFLNTLTPDDIGQEKIGDFLLQYEGFTDECWSDFLDRKISIKQLEDEILGEWKSKNKNDKVLDYGWLYDGEPSTPDVFWAIFGGVSIKKTKTNEQLLTEAYNEIMYNQRMNLKKVLSSMLNKKEFIQLSQIADSWISIFGITSYKTDTNKVIAISDENAQRDIQRIYGKLIRVYGDDKGNLDMMLNTIQKQEPLNTFDVFKDFDYLYGTRIHSNYKGVDLLFECAIDFLFDESQSIYIDDDNIIGSLDKIPDVKIVGKTIWPVGGKFSYSVLNRIFKEIKDVI